MPQNLQIHYKCITSIVCWLWSPTFSCSGHYNDFHFQKCRANFSTRWIRMLFSLSSSTTIAKAVLTIICRVSFVAIIIFVIATIAVAYYSQQNISFHFMPHLLNNSLLSTIKRSALEISFLPLHLHQKCTNYNNTLPLLWNNKDLFIISFITIFKYLVICC